MRHILAIAIVCILSACATTEPRNCAKPGMCDTSAPVELPVAL